jgi:hypothetical protein
MAVHVGGFGVVDIIVFSLNLAGSAIIGIYFARVGSRQKSNNEYLMACRKKHVVLASGGFCLYFVCVFYRCSWDS